MSSISYDDYVIQQGDIVLIEGKKCHAVYQDMRYQSSWMDFFLEVMISVLMHFYAYACNI